CAGYADGYPRAMSNSGTVMINGRPAPVIGRVCMDQMIVDVSEIKDAAIGDEVILIGTEEPLDAVTIAENSARLQHELVCGIAMRVPRVYVRGGKAVKTVNLLRNR
nr:alanine racemase [Clostridia bacterium]